MDRDQIKELKRKQKTHVLPFRINQRGTLKGHLYINNVIPLAIENTAFLHNRSSDLPIYSELGVEIGYLCFTKNKAVNNIFSLSEYHFISYLAEIPDETYLSLEYTLKYDYAVIYYDHLNDYLNYYYKSAPLWGYFNHQYPSISLSTGTTTSFSRLQATKQPKFSEEFYFEASVRGIVQSLAFERFLKYYHLLELNFDYDVIKRMKSLSIATDSMTIGTILNEYKKNDLDRLDYLFSTYCVDLNKIIDRLNVIKNFIPLAENIFFEYGKERNPLEDKVKFRAISESADGFTLSRCRSNKVANVSNAPTHSKFICKLTMYWIYRIRCSIAHNKVGEYLMTHKDEKFVAEFGEPLLLEVLNQIFR